MRGVVLYDGPSQLPGARVPIVCIATMESRNEKTGPMVQVWILRKNAHPLDALQSGRVKSICGRCPLINNGCYVRVEQAPSAIWKAYQRGLYPQYNAKQHRRLFSGRDIRLGAYGDPAALPTRLVAMLTRIGRSWTGYSHQLFWIDKRRANALARYLMASCHNPAQVAEAKRRGYRYFAIVPKDSDAPADALLCPNSSHGITCAQCRLCRGSSISARS
ncbi:MAG: hypothetical protein NXI32_31200, partial [bacterium]|nr:hypothetical protein [bacterium]